MSKLNEDELIYLGFAVGFCIVAVTGAEDTTIIAIIAAILCVMDWIEAWMNNCKNLREQRVHLADISRRCKRLLNPENLETSDAEYEKDIKELSKLDKLGKFIYNSLFLGIIVLCALSTSIELNANIDTDALTSISLAIVCLTIFLKKWNQRDHATEIAELKLLEHALLGLENETKIEEKIKV